MLKFALIGAGRIGKMHSEIITSNPETELKFVYEKYSTINYNFF